MLFWIILALGVAFTIYAVVTQYRHTDKTTSVPHRVWAALVAAAAALGAVIAGWLHLHN